MTLTSMRFYRAMKLRSARLKSVYFKDAEKHICPVLAQTKQSFAVHRKKANHHDNIERPNSAIGGVPPTTILQAA